MYISAPLPPLENSTTHITILRMNHEKTKILLQKRFESNVGSKKQPDDGDKSEECFVGQQISYL